MNDYITTADKVTDPFYMQQALTLAAKGRGSVSPNPMVGCLIVKNHQIVGQGYHQKAGENHAEIHALIEAGRHAQGATAYVTLEPCCHHGKTPPCTNALIQAGIKKIVIACRDPNPLVAGKGIAELQTAGIEVDIGLCEQEALQLNEFFLHYIQHKRPFVIAKWAMSLDGKTITQDQDTHQISCEASQYHAHQWRRSVDAILIGANTARKDNPQLTVRHASSIEKHPLRVVLAGKKPLPSHLTLFDPNLPGKTLVISAKKLKLPAHIELLHVPGNEQISLPTLLDELGKREITSLLVEGGENVRNQFFEQALVNKIHVYLAPTLIASLKQKQFLEKINFTKQGRDFFLEGNIYV